MVLWIKKLKIAITIALIFIIIIGVYGLYLSLTTEHYTIYVGLNDKDQNKQIISTSDAIETVDEIFFNNSVDFTRFGGKGEFKFNGSESYENSLVYEVYGSDRESIENISSQICKQLNQKSVLIRYERSFSTFYTPS